MEDKKDNNSNEYEVNSSTKIIKSGFLLKRSKYLKLWKK
jgi:hypothetical protein